MLLRHEVDDELYEAGLWKDLTSSTYKVVKAALQKRQERSSHITSLPTPSTHTYMYVPQHRYTNHAL